MIMRLNDSDVAAKEFLQSRVSHSILPYSCLQTWKRIKFLLSRKSGLALEFQVPGRDVKLQ